MLIVLPDHLTIEILNLLRLDSFIMLAMDESPSKRFQAFRLFLTLLDKHTDKTDSLIYSMCNQLNQFDQLEARFPETCISILIGRPFSFRSSTNDEIILREAAGHINERTAYVTILVSIIYSSRKNHVLCEYCLKFLGTLLKLELVRVDYLISKSGLLQVLFNLLRFFSEKTQVFFDFFDFSIK